MAFDAAHQVGVLAADADGVVDGDAFGAVELGVVVAFKAADHVAGDEGEHAGRLGLGDVFAEGGEGQHGRAALVDHGSDAGADADLVRVQAEAAADVAENVGVGVDHAGQDQLAGNVGHFFGRAGDLGRDGGDAAAADGDVHDPVELLRRVDDPAAAQDEVIRFRSDLVHGGVSDCGCHRDTDPAATFCKPGAA